MSDKPLVSPPDSYPLSALQAHLSKVIAHNLPQALWLRAELHQVQDNRGIWYLSLLERDEDEQIRARAEASIWKKQRSFLQKKYGADALTKVLRVGQEVLLKVQVHFHEVYGLRLEVQDLDLHYGLGKLALQREADLQALQRERLLDANKALPLALVPHRLALISSPKAAGLQDFVQHLQHNKYGYAFELSLFPAAVQGPQASTEMRKQLERIKLRAEEFDAVCVLRGGGSRSDLMAFDDLDLCRDLARFPKPILTGIGHDVDRSLSDEVAYRAFKTPTAVANFLLDACRDFEQELHVLYAKIREQMRLQFLRREEKLMALEARFPKQVQNLLDFRQRELAGMAARLALLEPDFGLKRGFALVRDAEGKLLDNLAARSSDLLELEMQDGRVWVQVKK